MGWNYDEKIGEAEKSYAAGTVTISSEEYSDLIRTIYEIKKVADQEHEDWREENTKAYELKKKLEALEKTYEMTKARLVDITAFMDSNESIKTQYRLYKIEQTNEDEEDN